MAEYIPVCVFALCISIPAGHGVVASGKCCCSHKPFVREEMSHWSSEPLGHHSSSGLIPRGWRQERLECEMIGTFDPPIAFVR